LSVLEAEAVTSLNWPFHPLWLTSKAETLVKIFIIRSLSVEAVTSMKTMPLFKMEADFSVLEAEAATSLNRHFHPPWLTSKAEPFFVKIS
jgi:hypothetical protein